MESWREYAEVGQSAFNSSGKWSPGFYFEGSVFDPLPQTE